VKALGDVMGSDKVVARILKNNKQEIRVGFNSYRGVALIYIRTFSLIEGKSEWVPTKSGVSMRVDHYPHHLEAVEKLGQVVAEGPGV